MQPVSVDLHALFALAFLREFDTSNGVDMSAGFLSHISLSLMPATLVPGFDGARIFRTYSERNHLLDLSHQTEAQQKLPVRRVRLLID